MEITKDWEELLTLLPLVRDGWEAQGHYHMEIGCRCLSCHVCMGSEMTNDLVNAFCDEQPEAERVSDVCSQELFTWMEARAIELLLKNRAKLGDLIKWYIQEEKRIVLGGLDG